MLFGRRLSVPRAETTAVGATTTPVDDGTERPAKRQKINETARLLDHKLESPRENLRGAAY